jgi:hypothetical protein
MAVVASVRVLEKLVTEAEQHSPGIGSPRVAGLVIIVQNGLPGAAPHVIDGRRVTELPAPRQSLEAADRAVSDAEGPGDGGVGFP